MRLIDADALLDKQEALYMKRHILFHGVTAYTIESAPTIDPETLPIVKELRKELERVTAEREAAVSDLEFTKICSHCKNCNSLILPIPKVCQECTHGSKWEWRGIQEVKDDE